MIGEAVRGFLCFLALSGVALADIHEQALTYQGIDFRVLRISPDKVELIWKNAEGEPYRNFGRVEEALKKQGKSLKFIMNAGIFEPGGIPSGLHIERQKKLLPLNLADAPGNFFLKPNGVIWIESGSPRKARIATSTAFEKYEQEVNRDSKRAVEFAAQSGPMLLIQGKRHPAFIKNSENRLHRNGIGVNSAGDLIFAITAKGQEVDFWDFAGLFLHLDCRDALFFRWSHLSNGGKSNGTTDQQSVRCHVRGNRVIVSCNPKKARETLEMSHL
jgi:uncharacterized protein YigE (DUF2233 family)